MKLRISLTVVLIWLIIGTMIAQTNKDCEVVTLQLNENGNFLNNPKIPVLLYKNAFDFENLDPVAVIEKVIKDNNWGGVWVNGIYNFQHYHSTAHEVLIVFEGWAEVQLGGPGNKNLRIDTGDVVILPAGTAHKRIDSGDNFAVVGAYPENQSWDMNYGKKNEKEMARINIDKVKLPKADPVFGENGKMFKYWK